MSKSRKEDRPFSGTEVGALIESLRTDISVIAEDVGAIRQDVSVLKEDVQEIKVGLTTVEDVIRVAFPTTNSRLNRLEDKVGLSRFH
jgi:DNA anti-recombination protein RmuC